MDTPPPRAPSVPIPTAVDDPVELTRRAQELIRSGQAAEAVELLVRAVGLRRDVASMWSVLGRALEPLERWKEAARAHEQAARLTTQDPQVYRDLGRALLKCHRLEDARRALLRAVGLAPRSAEALDMLGLVQHATGRRTEARLALGRALELEPDRASAHHRLGLLLAERDELAPALDHLTAAAAAAPKNAVYQRELARVALRVRDLPRARRAATRALALAPDDAPCHVVLGWVLESSGRAREAVERYRRALDLDPMQASPYYRLARLGALDDPEAVASALEARGRPAHERADLLFARAEVLRRRGAHDEAWSACAEANAATAEEVEYDATEHRALVGRIAAGTPRELFEARAGMGDPIELPVFVLGAPGSGVAAVERVLAAHPQVHALGAHGGVLGLAGALRGRVGTTYPGGLRLLERQDALRLAARYLRSFERPTADFDRLVDRAPDTLYYLGLVALVFPNARVVHVRRDPRAACVTSWFTHAGPKRSPFACDLEHLVAFHEDHQRLMQHWCDVTTLRIHEVEYEALASDPHEATRGLLEFLEVAPATSSATFQAPAPVGEWRHFEHCLGPIAHLSRAAREA